MNNANKLIIPLLICVIGSLTLVASLFLPFASAKDSYREYLESYPDAVYSEEAGMSNKDAADISLVEFVKIDAAAIEIGVSRLIAIVNMALIIAFGVFAAFTLLFSILRKPVAVMVFDILSFITMQIVRFDFEDRGEIPGSTYDWGIAQFICYIGVLAVIAGAVVMLVFKIKNKKSATTIQQ